MLLNRTFSGVCVCVLNDDSAVVARRRRGFYLVQPADTWVPPRLDLLLQPRPQPQPACLLHAEGLLEPRRHGSLTGDSKLCTAAQLRWDHIWCWDTQPPRSSNQRQVQRSSRPSTNPPSQSRIFILRRRHFVRRNNCGYISFQHSVRTTTFRFIYFLFHPL